MQSYSHKLFHIETALFMPFCHPTLSFHIVWEELLQTQLIILYPVIRAMLDSVRLSAKIQAVGMDEKINSLLLMYWRLNSLPQYRQWKVISLLHWIKRLTKYFITIRLLGVSQPLGDIYRRRYALHFPKCLIKYVTTIT